MSSQTNNFLQKLWNNAFFRPILLALVAVIVLVFLIKIFLDVFTRHGESEPVPDFTGMTLDSVKIVAKKADLRFEIADSVFRRDFPRGAVSRQNPEAGIHVKKNRKVYLTINSLSPRKEAIPDVVGFSLRQAKSILSNKGFYVGALTYVSDIATNNVLAQTYNSSSIEPGVMMPVGTGIDLKLGLDSTYAGTSIPNVVGLGIEQARGTLIDNSLNCNLIFDNSVKNITDSLNSSVYKQDPTGGSAKYGSKVNIYLRPKKKK